MTIAFLLVTCCLERSRSEMLGRVIRNIQEEAPELELKLTVFDNASTEVGTIDVLTDCFFDVHQADRNVGYWSAIDWWLDRLSSNPPKYTYIIESDMIHYGFNKIWTCAAYLDHHPEVGSVRLHEYSLADRHLYNKDEPRSDSRRSLWQSHTNKVTHEKVDFGSVEDGICSTTFLTQLPALNRYETMVSVFQELSSMRSFTEFDFQREYWNRFQRTGILDGGIFHCNLNPYGSTGITGSWTPAEELRRLGYQPTRIASITPREQYTVRAMR